MFSDKKYINYLTKLFRVNECSNINHISSALNTKYNSCNMKLIKQIWRKKKAEQICLNNYLLVK